MLHMIKYWKQAELLQTVIPNYEILLMPADLREAHIISLASFPSLHNDTWYMPYFMAVLPLGN